MSHDLGQLSEEQLDRIEQPGGVDDDVDNIPDLDIAHCGCCHLTFTSVTGFDVHR